MFRTLALSLLTLFSAAASLSSASADPSEAPPLVDGRCSEYAGLNAEVIQIDEAVMLRIYQDRHFVWLCYTYPEGSFGTLDLTVDSPALEAALNLHVSAQLGDWPAAKPELAPKEGNSEEWWNHTGWTANEVWFNGYRMRESENGEEQVANWRNAPARELQLSKAHFGRGDWKLRFDISAIQGQDGSRYSITYPGEDTFYTLKVY